MFVNNIRMSNEKKEKANNLDQEATGEKHFVFLLSDHVNVTSEKKTVQKFHKSLY